LLALRGRLGSSPVVGCVRVAHLFSVLHCLFSSCKTQVPNIASFSGLSILDFLLVFFDIKANVFLFSQA
jgi:hypothetical protein